MPFEFWNSTLYTEKTGIEPNEIDNAPTEADDYYIDY